MFIRNDKISEIVNDSDSDGGNCSEISDNTCKVRPVQGVGLRPLACSSRRFESHLGHGCWSVVCAVCLLSHRSDHSSKRSPTDYGTSLCVIKKPRVMRWPRKDGQSRWATP
jgi:hypothetical protein